MLKFYNCYATTYHNETKIGTCYCGRYLVEEGTKQNFIDYLTWENLKEKYYKNGCTYSFNYWNMRRGKLISFFNVDIFKIIKNKNYRDIKEWKEKELNIKIEYIFKEDNYKSLEDILKWPDIEKATQYLKEKGINLN